MVTKRTILVLLAALALGACVNQTKNEVPQEQRALVLSAADIATAEEGSVDAGVIVTGSLQPAWIVAVKAQVPGNVTNIRVDRGTRVNQGQPLATIAAEGIRGQAEGARYAVAAAEAALALGQQRLDAARTLRGAGALSQIDFQAAESGLAAAQAQLSAARAQAAATSEAARRATITAPIAGVVSERLVEEGEAVSPGDRTFTVVRSDQLELSGQVPVDAAARVRVGQPVVFTLDAYPNQEFRGAVARIEPMADPATRQVGVYLRLPNPGNLIGGQFATGRILSQSSALAVVVPETAIHHTGAEACVFVIEGDRLSRRVVQLGPTNPATATIAVQGSVKPGDRILARPPASLTDSTRVQVSAPPRPASASDSGTR